MTYALAAALIGSLGIIGYLAYALVGATKNEHASDAALIAAGKAQIEAERNLRDAESQRDTEKAARDKAEAENAELRAQLAQKLTDLLDRAVPRQLLEQNLKRWQDQQARSGTTGKP